MLRKLKPEDAEYMLEWMHDPSIYRIFKADFKNMTKDDVIHFIENSFTEKNVNFAFTDDEDEYLGTVSLKNISKEDKNAEYAIVTRKKAQGNGYAFAATIELLRYAFEELKLHKVYLNVLEENIRADKFYQKVGFAYEGMAKEHIIIQNTYRNLKWYSITEQKFRDLYRV